MKMMYRLFSAILILLFTYTALSKLGNLTSFRSTIAASPLFNGLGSQLSLTIPLAELATALLIFIPRTIWFGLRLSFVLLLLFTSYLVYMLLFVPELPCSCGGVLQALSWKQHLWFNGSFILLNAAAIFLHQKLRA